MEKDDAGGKVSVLVPRYGIWFSGGIYRVVCTYCVWKYSCNSSLLLFERETSRRVTMWPLSNSNELLARIGSDDDSGDEDSA